MPPPPGYLRFCDLCERMQLARNTVYKAIRRASADGVDLEPHRFGNTTLYTEAQAAALEEYRDGRAIEDSLESLRD